jgi:hypothetical protein
LENDFYQKNLNAHPGLVKKIRHTFELLKPETVKIIRQTLEGEFRHNVTSDLRELPDRLLSIYSSLTR